MPPARKPAAAGRAGQPPQATRKGLTRGGFLGKFVVKSLERPTERVALGTLLHRLPRPIHPKTSPCKPARGGPTIHAPSTSPTTRSYIVGPPLAGGLWRPSVTASGATPCGWPADATGLPMLLARTPLACGHRRLACVARIVAHPVVYDTVTVISSTKKSEV